MKYEVELGLSMIYRKVDVVYDPADISVLTIECEGFPSCRAFPLVIGYNSARKPKLPEHFEKTVPTTSRLLDAAENKNARRQAVRRTAISFKDLKEGESHV